MGSPYTVRVLQDGWTTRLPLTRVCGCVRGDPAVGALVPHDDCERCEGEGDAGYRRLLPFAKTREELEALAEEGSVSVRDYGELLRACRIGEEYERALTEDETEAPSPRLRRVDQPDLPGVAVPYETRGARLRLEASREPRGILRGRPW